MIGQQGALFDVPTTLVAGQPYDVDGRAFNTWVDIECRKCDRIYPTPARFVHVVLNVACTCQRGEA